MKMKTRLATLVTGTMLFSMSLSSVAGDKWETDFEKAKAEAVRRNVPILVNFSGSDWCGWCIRLDGEVFSKDGFKAFAKGNLVLFQADFPMKKKLPEQISKQNKALAEKYGVKGYPTVLLLDKKGKLLARTGYQPGGAKKYVKHIKELIDSGKS